MSWCIGVGSPVSSGFRGIRNSQNRLFHRREAPTFFFPPPLASSGAQYPTAAGGELWDAGVKQQQPQQQQQRKRIAGIDQDELLDPALLADPDSCFCEFQGVHIHHKIYDATQSQSTTTSTIHIPNNADTTSYQHLGIGIPMILLHGFGASVFSWNQVIKPLAEITGSKVAAFDRPAFGLTSRGTSIANKNNPINPYTMAFAVHATLYFIHVLAAQKAILVGHSAGCLVAVDTYFEAPERIAALILVAPAIFAPRIVPIPKVAEGSGSDTSDQIQGGSPTSDNSLLKQFLEIISKFTQKIAGAVRLIVKGMADMFNSLYKKALSAILHSAVAVMLVRIIIDRFGTAAIKNAWYDSKQVTEEILQGYTKPLRVKGWDRALVEFTAAMLLDNESPRKAPLGEKLGEISCPVLIVTGDSDRIVPAWNAERLSRAIPGSCFQVIKNCGHLPQEEKPKEFVSIVHKFLQTAFGYSEPKGQPLQAVAT